MKLIDKFRRWCPQYFLTSLFQTPLRKLEIHGHLLVHDKFCRITEQIWRDLEIPCLIFCGKGSSVQLCLENLQWWKLHHIPGEVVPIIVLAVNKHFPKMKLLPVYLLPVVLCPPHLALCRGRVSVLFVAVPLLLKHCGEVPPQPSLLQGEKTLFLQSFLRVEVSSPLIIFVVIVSTLSSVLESFFKFWILGIITRQSTSDVAWQMLSRVGWSHFYLC